MDFFDPLNIAGRAGTPTPTADDPEPTLNEEINEVIGQFGRFWGGFRKQSQAVFEVARKDLTEVVSQAQKELSKLAEQSTAPSSDSSSNDDSNTASGSSNDATDDHPRSPLLSSEDIISPVQSLFSRIQSSLPPNISTALQENLPSSLKDASGNVHIDFAQLKTTLTTEFQRVQGVTRAQAEEYVHKSEALLKEAGAFLKEAVKVVPPDPNEKDDIGANVMWDGLGSDLWVMPSPVGSHGWGASSSGKGKGKQRASSTGSGVMHLAAGSRVEALLQRLMRDPEMIKLNPAEDDAIKSMYEEWVKNEVESKGSGMDGDYWRNRIREVLEDKANGAILSTTRDAVVPELIDEQTFWTRYFFRIHQIETEEERRKAILSGATQAEEEFSWEDEEDEDAVTPGKETVVPRPSSETLTGGKATTTPSDSGNTEFLSVTPANTSPRESSDSSYDVVSSGHLSETVVPPGITEPPKKEDEEADSDWE